MEDTEQLLDTLKNIFLKEAEDRGTSKEDVEILEEQIEKLLKPGTVFHRDVKRITNQVTFNQFLDRSGIPDFVAEPIYKHIHRLRSIADLFPDKGWIWRALYLGAVYQALMDSSRLFNVMDKYGQR